MLYTENRGKIHFFINLWKNASNVFLITSLLPYYAFDINNGINLYVGCPTDGYLLGPECCPFDKCQVCNLETGTCLECQPGYKVFNVNKVIKCKYKLDIYMLMCIKIILTELIAIDIRYVGKLSKGDSAIVNSTHSSWIWIRLCLIFCTIRSVLTRVFLISGFLFFGKFIFSAKLGNLINKLYK